VERYADEIFEYGSCQEVASYIWSISEHGPLSQKIIDLMDKKSEWLLSHDNFVAVAMVARSLAKHNVTSSTLIILLKEKCA
jgi:hypothetical protein